MLKIIIISLICVFLSLIIKQKSPELSLIISCAGGVLIFTLCFDYLTEIISFYGALGGGIGIDNNIIKVALKIIGIGILTEFVSELASDFGNNVISSKVVFGGRVIICLIMLPIVRNLVSLLFSFY